MSHVNSDILLLFQSENTPDMYIQQQDTHYLLRPEFVESLWAMYQITGNKTYQAWGWQVFLVRFARSLLCSSDAEHTLSLLVCTSVGDRTLYQGGRWLYISWECSGSNRHQAS